ncbi:hypothetical protein GE09DRAFT_1060473 [Coniochaeta sp. 2T2.1]|nr:hypothetical protein GE09DRAFT_1060473 [Coniochaeta sp. 2T2.1]
MDDNPRPNKRPRRNLAGVRQAPPKPKPIPRQPSREDVYFVYTNKTDNKNPTEPWEDVLWDRADAFTELLRQWRADIRALHNMYDVHKFNSHIEFIDNSDDEQVHLTYRVWKKEKSASPLQYVGHVRYRGSVDDGCGSVDIVTRDHTMEFPDAPPPTQENNGKAFAADQPTKKIGNPRLEKAVLAFMDDGNDRLHCVRLVTGHHEWNFKFEGRNTYFSARRTEVDDERAEATNGTIEDLEAQQKGPSSEARPFHDTLLAIGERPAQPRARVIDSCGRNAKYTQIKEEEFREWTGRALFLSYNELRNSDTSEEGPDWYDAAAGNILFNERFAGKLYYDGLPLSHWEVAPTDPNKVGLKHGYDIRKPSETAADYTILSPDAEVKVIGSIWHRAVVTHRTKATSALDRLLKTDPPSRDALAAIQYLSTGLKDTRTIEDLWGELERTETASKKPPWYLPASFNGGHAETFIKTQEKAGYEVMTIPDSYWSLFTILKSVRSPEQEMRRQAGTRPVEPPAEACIIVSKEPTAVTDADAALIQSTSPAASTRTSQEQTPVETSTVPSTEPSVSVERTMAAPGLDHQIKYREASNFRRNPEMTMRESVPLGVTPLGESRSSTEMLSTELLSDLFPGTLHKRIQELETENQAQKERIAALKMAASERSDTSHPRDGDRMILDDDGSINVSRGDIAAQVVPDGVSDVIMDDSAEERVFPAPSDWFPNEVMRLVQACLALCPQPLNTYTCLPIEGGTGVVVAGFCRFDHNQSMLKIHKDWLSLDRMRLEFGSLEDTTQADLLCHTVLTLWEDLLKTEAPSCLDQHGGHAVWARCRGEIRRRLLGYRQACRQITVPESLLKRGELTVVTSTLFTSGWAQDTDIINLSVHYKDCPWARQNTRMADPLDCHFTDITAPKHVNENGNLVTHASCDSARFCHGVTNKGIATHPFFALKFRGLDYRKKFFIVAKNLSQFNSLVVVLEGHHTPFANHGAAYANLESHVADYVARGFLVHPVFRGPRRSPGQLLSGLHAGEPPSPSEPSAAPETFPKDPVSERLESLQRKVAEEQEKLAQLNAEIPPDPPGLQVALEVIDMLQKRIDQERRCIASFVPSRSPCGLSISRVPHSCLSPSIAPASASPTDCRVLLDKARRARRDPTRDPRVHQAVAIAPLWTVHDTTRALVEAGLAPDTSTVRTTNMDPHHLPKT